ncbi:MAG: hypothetical protein PUG73_03510 [Pseudomonadota bacterium]|nr:hypothetical protein [Pseudomonadota bacterium]
MLERLNGLQRAALVLTALITAMSAAEPLFPVLSRTVTGNAFNMALLTAVPFLLTVCFLNERNSFAVFTGKIFRPLIIVLLLSPVPLIAHYGTSGTEGLSGIISFGFIIIMLFAFLQNGTCWQMRRGLLYAVTAGLTIAVIPAHLGLFGSEIFTENGKILGGAATCEILAGETVALISVSFYLLGFERESVTPRSALAAAGAATGVSAAVITWSALAVFWAIAVPLACALILIRRRSPKNALFAVILAAAAAGAGFLELAAAGVTHSAAELIGSLADGAHFAVMSVVSGTPFTGSGYGTALYNYLMLVPASGESVPHVTHSAISALIGGAGAVGVLMILAAAWALLRVIAFNRCPATLRLGFAFLILPLGSVLILTDAYIDLCLCLVFAAFLFNSAGADYRSITIHPVEKVLFGKLSWAFAAGIAIFFSTAAYTSFEIRAMLRNDVFNSKNSDFINPALFVGDTDRIYWKNIFRSTIGLIFSGQEELNGYIDTYGKKLIRTSPSGANFENTIRAMVRVGRAEEAEDTAALASRLFPDQKLRFEDALRKPEHYDDAAGQRERLRETFREWKGEDVIRQRSENMAGNPAANGGNGRDRQ